MVRPAFLIALVTVWAARLAPGADLEALQKKVDQAVAQLAGTSAQQRLGAEVRLGELGADGFPLIEAASRRADLKPDVAAALARVVERERPRYLPRLCRQKAREATWKWNERTALAAYEKVGKKDPRWDAAARAGIKQYVAPNGVAAARPILEKAVEAGCDDPLVLYFESRCVARAGTVDLVSLERLYRTAAESMLASNYPASRKCLALKNYAMFVGNNTYGNADSAPGGPAAIQRGGTFMREAIRLWPQFVKEPGAPEEFLYDLGTTLFNEFLGPHGPRQTFELLDPALKEALPNSPLPLRFEGAYEIDYAWHARGKGFANTVTPEGWKLMKERLELAETALTKAWEMDSDDPSAAVLMLKVELGQGQGPERMETWYQRAMKADPDNLEAPRAKMYYLEPKWYGSAEAMLAFGRELRDSQNYVARPGNLLIEAHNALSRYSQDPDAYFHQADVWDDIRSVFEPFLAASPDDPDLHSAYAFQACRCAQWALAREQFALLGDKVSARHFGNRGMLEHYRRLAAGNGADTAP